MKPVQHPVHQLGKLLKLLVSSATPHPSPPQQPVLTAPLFQMGMQHFGLHEQMAAAAQAHHSLASDSAKLGQPHFTDRYGLQ